MRLERHSDLASMLISLLQFPVLQHKVEVLMWDYGAPNEVTWARHTAQRPVPLPLWVKKGPSQICGDTFSPGRCLLALSLCPCTSLIRIKKKMALQG